MFQKVYRGFDLKNRDHKRLYNIWYDMRRRCSQPQNKRWKHYGGKGISVCEEWDSNFQNFFDWALLNGYSSDLTIDRIDNQKGYCPENCRWADIITQANNRTNNHYVHYKGKTMTMMELSRETGMSYYTLRARLHRGKSLEEALEGSDSCDN